MIKFLQILLLYLAITQAYVPHAHAQSCIPPSCNICGCNEAVGDCQEFCTCVSDGETGKKKDKKTTIGHITDEFTKHQNKWLVEHFTYNPSPSDPVGLLAAMKLMTVQLTTTAMQQVKMIGLFFDAKHQLETQRIFQHLTAKAHKNYHPSKEQPNW